MPCNSIQGSFDACDHHEKNHRLFGYCSQGNLAVNSPKKGGTILKKVTDSPQTVTGKSVSGATLQTVHNDRLNVIRHQEQSKFFT